MKKFLLVFFQLFVVFSVHSDEPFNGIIYDITGKPIKGAKIYNTNPKRFATSDKQGRFGLTDVLAKDTIHVKVKGIKEWYNIPVEGRKSMKIYISDVTLPKIEEDQELVDIGYGFVKRRESTGVSDGISGEELIRTGQKDILSALKGKVAGLDITPSGVTIRGKKSFMLSSEPLYVVDGVIVSSFIGINLHDVDYVEVLKDASIYGTRGANGAILVHTKSASKKY